MGRDRAASVCGFARRVEGVGEDADGDAAAVDREVFPSSLGAELVVALGADGAGAFGADDRFARKGSRQE